MPFAATWMDLEIIIPSEASQTKINITWLSHVESKKKKIQINLYKTEIDPQIQQAYGY